MEGPAPVGGDYRTGNPRVYMQMRQLCIVLVTAAGVFAQTYSPRTSDNRGISPANGVRIREFYRLATQIQDQIWPDWSHAPKALLLVTPDKEFLTHHPAPPTEFQEINDGFYARQRTFPIHLLATFPAFGPPPVIVIGEPENTSGKTSTPWLITLMHEHFHQLQDAQPGYFAAVQSLGLSHGDTTGMWMLNYPFPYEKPGVKQRFAELRDLLLSAVTEPDGDRFKKLARRYIGARKQFFARLQVNDMKYFEFQLWQEGIARYSEIRAAEAAASYLPTAEYAGLPDFTPFKTYGAKLRGETLDELRRARLDDSKREVVYSFGATEGLLLDRLHPDWKTRYFKQPFSLNSFFDFQSD